MTLKETIGQTIKKRRHELNIEQSDLQEYANVGATTLSNLEQGQANITIAKLEDIIEVLGLELILRVKEKV